MKDLLDSKQQEASKKYSQNIMLECTPDRTQLYPEDFVNISCNLDNKGDKAFTKVNVCIDDNCSVMPLNIEMKTLSFVKNFSSLGLKNVEIKVYNEEFSKTNYVSLNILDTPIVRITDMKYPQTVKFDDKFSISFRVSKDSDSSPRNVSIKVIGPLSTQEWDFDSLKDERVFNILSNGRSMKMNDNEYTILIDYQDNKLRSYQTKSSLTIKSEADFFQNIVLWCNGLVHSIESIFA